jgi:hypothetical protein
VDILEVSVGSSVAGHLDLLGSTVTFLSSLTRGCTRVDAVDSVEQKEVFRLLFAWRICPRITFDRDHCSALDAVSLHWQRR